MTDAKRLPISWWGPFPCLWVGGIRNEKLKALNFVPLKSCSLLRNTEKWQIWMRIWHLVIPPSPIVYLPPRAKINLIGVSATGDLSFFPFYVKSIAKGLPWPKCSLLPLQITCYHALVTWVLHTQHSGLTQLPQNWARGGIIKKKKKCISEKEECYFPQITKSPSTYNINQNSWCQRYADSGLLQTDRSAPRGPRFPNYSPIKVH